MTDAPGMMTVHTDGGSRGNPGNAAIGVVVTVNDVQTHTISRSIGVTTNNVAEYSAVLSALEYLASLPSLPETIAFYLDSQLVVEQIKGHYKISNDTLKVLHGKIKTLLSSLPATITFTHVPRSQNKTADLLVNQALDALA